MANDEHVALLKQGVAAWNAWREANPDICPDLRRVKLRGWNLREFNLSEADLRGAVLSGADFIGADLSDARLQKADLSRAKLCGVPLIEANLNRGIFIESKLCGANLYASRLLKADLTGAHLNGADLRHATLVDTYLTDADLTGCRIYGISTWGLKLEGTKQQDLVVTHPDEPTINVDNIEVAQFMYLLVDNPKIRGFIDTVTSKAVLILGSFTQERKPVLKALRDELRQREYLPILFDFEKSRSRNTDETITLLAGMARFVVADISDAKSVLQELRAIVPNHPSLPVQPIILAMQEEPGMFDFYRNFQWFLNVHRYASQEQLIVDLGEKVIRPAELKVLDLRGST
jgi:Pentapeptide repeats (8 copies)